mmetsp:Transcript_61995/g.110220  ORF Transcript_61995/g.110220 Transcript_61995/m.110220 type:complete len:80 (+) Transcript_61995:299-538(+)
MHGRSGKDAAAPGGRMEKESAKLGKCTPPPCNDAESGRLFGANSNNPLRADEVISSIMLCAAGLQRQRDIRLSRCTLTT